MENLYTMWTGLDSGWGGFWWAYQSKVTGGSKQFGGVGVKMYVWSWVGSTQSCDSEPAGTVCSSDSPASIHRHHRHPRDW